MPKAKTLAPFKRIRFKVSLLVVLLLMATTLAFSLMTLRIINRRILNEVIKRAEALSRGAASTAGYALVPLDLLGLDNIVYRIKSSNPDVEYAAIVNKEGRILVHSDTRKTGGPFVPVAGRPLENTADGTTVSRIPLATRWLIEVRTPIVFMDKTLGLVVLAVNETSVIGAQMETRDRILAAFFLLLLLGIGASVLLSTFLTKPVRELSAGVAELKEGCPGRPLRVYSRDELGRLTDSFNDMAALITDQKNSLKQYAQELEEAYVSTVRVLAAAIDARDSYTLGHSTRVAQLCVELGRELGFDQEQLEELEIACLFHDVGKIKIPDSILLKGDKLSANEQKEMRKHPEYGAEILSKARSLLRFISAVRHHHECYDGSGYPDGLKAQKIPQSAAIISLADIYDAMTSDRPYRRGLSNEAARKEIEGRAGRQFDPDLAARFVELLRRRASRTGQSQGESV